MKIVSTICFVITCLWFYYTYARIEYIVNKYNDIQAVVVEEQSLESFEQNLVQLCALWQAHGYKIARLTIPTEYACYIPIALKHSFIYHHTTTQELVMMREIQKGSAHMLPPYATQTLGVLGIVIDKDNTILVVKERFAPELGYKLSGGRVEFSEDIGIAAVREVKEETGIDCEFLGIVAFSHEHRSGAEAISDLCFGCLLRPLSRETHIQESEITEARWMDYEEFKKIATDVSAQFLAAYEAGAVWAHFTIDSLNQLYAPHSVHLTGLPAPLS